MAVPPDANWIELGISTITTIVAVGFAIFRLGRAVEKFEVVGRQQSMELSEMKSELKILTTVVKDLALQNQRQDMFEDRLGRYERTVDDLRRGVGWIGPAPGFTP